MSEPIEVIRVSVVWVLLLIGAVGVGAASPPTTVERTEGPLHLTASVKKTTYVVGEVVEVTLTVKHAGAGPLTMAFQSGHGFDFVARLPHGGDVWVWSHDKVFTQAFVSRTLQAGEIITYRGTWDQRDLQGRRVEPGTYELVAILMASIEGKEKRSISLPPLSITIQP